MNKLLWLAVIGALSSLSMVVPSNVFAADINCTNVATLCIGTFGDDRMIANGPNHGIDGSEGNDQISSNVGSDRICGSGGNDKINGGSGEDEIVGDYAISSGLTCSAFGGFSQGSDILVGGPGPDTIFHGTVQNGGNPTNSDGHRDIIDCGGGDDEAFINISVDHDVATNCEQIHAG